MWKGGDLGLRPHGPIPAVATKFYVRRKEALEIRGEAQINMEPAVDPLSASKMVSRYKGDLRGTSTTKASQHEPNSKYQDNSLGQVNHDILEKQCALVKEMGLTHGEDSQKTQGMMLDMEKRDNKVAAEMGFKYHQS